MPAHKNIRDLVFRLAGGRPCEAVITSVDSSLTRFADNVISQNVSDTATEISVRVMERGRAARFTLNQPSERRLREAFAIAGTQLNSLKKDPLLLPLPRPVPVAENKKLFFPATAALSPSDRAGRVAAFAGKCRKAGAVGYGVYENGSVAVTVANSLGVSAFHRETYAVYEVTARKGEGFGWAQASGHDVRELDLERAENAALRKAAASAKPRDLKPGRYTVILEPAAVADLLEFLCFYGFGAQAYEEGQSFVRGRLGKKVLSGLVTIEDDALDGPSAGMPFDYEGLPKRKVTLIGAGIARGLVHDRRTAARAGAASTGHALPQPNTCGPLPSNLCMAAGGVPLEEMIRGTKKGIRVTSFHYTNLLKPLTVEMTGMTRNGTFLIENGRVACAVRNMRFTESAVGAFKRVEAVGDRREIFFSSGRVTAPALKINGFNFSSATEF